MKLYADLKSRLASYDRKILILALWLLSPGFTPIFAASAPKSGKYVGTVTITRSVGVASFVNSIDVMQTYRTTARISDDGIIAIVVASDSVSPTSIASNNVLIGRITLDAGNGVYLVLVDNSNTSLNLTVSGNNVRFFGVLPNDYFNSDDPPIYGAVGRTALSFRLHRVGGLLIH